MQDIATLLNWPIVTLVAVLTAMFLFHKQIAALLLRAKSISKAGFESFDLQHGQKSDEKKGIEDFLRGFENPLLLEIEELIRNDLKLRKIETAEDKERALIKDLAIVDLILIFEFTYSNIWKSQMDCLKHMNSFPSGIDEAAIRSFYEIGKSEFPNMYENYEFVSWTKFLINGILITRANSLFHITIRGKEFLKYLIDRSMPGPYVG